METENVIEEFMPGLNADTGELGYKTMESALAVMSGYDEHERPVQFSFRELAESILKSMVASGTIGTYSQNRLNDKETEVRNAVASMLCGWWDTSATLKPASGGSGWICLDENGDQSNLTRNYVVFMAVPEDKHLHHRVGPYVAIRIKSTAVTPTGRKVSLQSNDKGYLDTTNTVSGSLLDGIIYAYPTLAHATEAMDELKQACRTLWSWARTNQPVDDPELEAIDRAEARLQKAVRLEPTC